MEIVKQETEAPFLDKPIRYCAGNTARVSQPYTLWKRADPDVPLDGLLTKKAISSFGKGAPPVYL
jgi:hypothetical protein